MARVTHDLEALAGGLDGDGRTLRARASAALLKVSFDLERRVKEEMPVDTGRARASWGHYTPGDLRAASPESGASDAVWEEQALRVEQGSNVPYIEVLNAGHSQQAPAGFIDAAWLSSEATLEAAITSLV